MTRTAIAPAAPSVRVRTRVPDVSPPQLTVAPTARVLDVSAPPEVEKVAKTEAAKDRALEMLAHLRDSYDSKAKADKILKELAALNGSGEINDFTLEFNGKTYDGKVVVEEANDVSVEKLFAEVTKVEFFKMAKATQGAVKDHGGSVLLNRVLVSIKKDPEFKVKSRK